MRTRTRFVGPLAPPVSSGKGSRRVSSCGCRVSVRREIGVCVAERLIDQTEGGEPVMPGGGRDVDAVPRGRVGERACRAGGPVRTPREGPV